MDIQLREISGLEVTRRLRGDDRSRRIPIVAVTAFAMGWHEREALDSGCDAYISKPISVLGFLNTVVVPVTISPLVASGLSDRRVGLAPTGKAPPCHGARGLPTFRPIARGCRLGHGGINLS